MIIQTEPLFRWMADHNIQSVSREQLEKFAHEPKQTDDFREGVVFALKYLVQHCKSRLDIWQGTTLGECATCDYLEPEVEVCCCEESDKYAKFVTKTMTCERWKQIGKEDS